MGGFQVGDVVVCVDDSPCSTDRHDEIVPCPYRKGDVVRVVRLCPWRGDGIDVTPKRYPDEYITDRRFQKLPLADEQFTETIRACKPERVGEPSNV